MPDPVRLQAVPTPDPLHRQDARAKAIDCTRKKHKFMDGH